MTIKIIMIGDLNNVGWNKSTNAVYSVEGVAPTITAGGGGNVMPKIEVDYETEIDDNGNS